MGKVITHRTSSLFNFIGRIQCISRTDDNGDCIVGTYETETSAEKIYLYKYNIFSNSTSLVFTRQIPSKDDFNIQYVNNIIYIVYREPFNYLYKYRLWYMTYDLNTNEYTEPTLIYTENYSIAEQYPSGLGNISIKDNIISVAYIAMTKSGITRYYKPFIIEYNLLNNETNTYTPQNSLTSTTAYMSKLFFSNYSGSTYWDSNYCNIFLSPNQILTHEADRNFNSIFIPETKYYISTGSYGVINDDYTNTSISKVTSTYIPCVLDDNYIVTIDNTKSLYNIFILEEYDLTYTFKTNSEDVVLTNKTPIDKITVSNIGDNVGISINTVDGGVYGVNYTIDIPEGKTFVGLALKPNSTSVYIPIGETQINISESVTFYPVYQTYNPPSRTFQLNLYKNSAEPNRVDKTDYLEQIGTLYGAFRDETSITNMSIIIQQAEFPQFNYAYIPIFSRYYYVTDITSFRENLWEISLSVDVLMSYKDAIKSCYAFVDRNEFTYNDMLIDKKRVIEQGYDIETITITNDLFDPDSKGDFVLEGLGFGSLVGDLYPITTDLTNVVASDYNPNNMGVEQVTLGFVAESGYSLPEDYDTANFSVTNATVVSWSGVTGILVISNATGNVTITIKGVTING